MTHSEETNSGESPGKPHSRTSDVGETEVSEDGFAAYREDIYRPAPDTNVDPNFGAGPPPENSWGETELRDTAHHRDSGAAGYGYPAPGYHSQGYQPQGYNSQGYPVANFVNSGPYPPPGPPPQPQPKRSAGPWIIIGIIVAVAIAAGALLISLSRKPAPSPTAVTHTVTAPATQPAATTATPETPTPTTPSRRPGTLPAGITSCASTGGGTYTQVGVGPATSCPFADNVRIAYNIRTQPGDVQAYSAARGQIFTMNCQYADELTTLVICRGGDDASVYLL